MRKFTIKLPVPTPSDLGKLARATKSSVSNKVNSDTRLANKVERLRGKLDKAVTEFAESYKTPEVATPAAVVPQLVSLNKVSA